ncbi:hypothetical protein T440DRAFT_526595, partial [Plenodomus tracheiphilus IPT5]
SQDASLGIKQSPASPLLDCRTKSSADDRSVPHLLQSNAPESTCFPQKISALTHDEALLFHHFTVHLSHWLDCTNAMRIMSLRVPEMARECPILRHAVLCFAARHRREDRTAEAAHQRCVTLLIDRLNEDSASYNEMLLAAVLLLHFADQLNVQSRAGLRNKHHLTGSSGMLRASQSTRFVDPSAPTFREAAFWVYLRQCLYNATISQQPLDIDFSLRLHPAPDSLQDLHPLAWLRLETAWANQMLWHAACVANFCFTGAATHSEPTLSTNQWQELWEMIQKWHINRPRTFDPIGSGPAEDGSVFPDIWFTADWHVISYVFYHFSCVLLLKYKPGPKSGIRLVHDKVSNLDRRILDHAQAICCACKSSPQNVQLLVILCHTVFIWGPLLSNPEKRIEVIHLLILFEQDHSWGTAWIVTALKIEWGMD